MKNINFSLLFCYSHKSALSETYLMNVCTKKVRFISSYFGHDIKKNNKFIYN